MGRYSKLAVALMVPILLAVFFTAGCISKSLSGTKPVGSASKKESKSPRNIDIKKWRERLPIEIISIYPNQAKFARIYGKVENRSDQELELVRISALGEKKKQIGVVTVESLKPREARTFEIQTAVPLSEIENPSVTVSDISIEGKP
ncbi:MAG: hypothetical protein WA148_00305 [Actinomycetota bacterium]